MTKVGSIVASVLAGGALSVVTVFVAVDQLSPNASQSDSPLIVYGNSK
jgi:hypothetical protein